MRVVLLAAAIVAATSACTVTATQRDTGRAPAVCGHANDVERGRYDGWGDAYGLTLVNDCPVLCGETHARCKFKAPSGDVLELWCNGDHTCKESPQPASM